METNLVVEGIKFMFLGMGTVFLFLIILIFLMNVMSNLVHKLFPEPQANDTAQANSSANNDNKKVIAAITAAIAHHRQQG
jgi:oxaloacetate decarboxylase gamma subunit